MQQNMEYSKRALPGLNQDEVIELTYGMVTNNSNLYALKMQNDMINDETKEGDIVILQRQSHVQNGDMAVVRFNCGQLAIKQYFRENGHVRLQSATSKKQAKIVAPEAIQVEGKVVAIIREVE
jgi:repressor LexA